MKNCCIAFMLFIVALGVTAQNDGVVSVKSVQLKLTAERHVSMYFQSTDTFRIRKDFHRDSVIPYPDEYETVKIRRIRIPTTSLKRFEASDFRYYSTANLKQRSRLVFSGKLQMKNYNWFFYTDSAVNPGHTYLYFLKSKGSIWHGPYPVAVRYPQTWYFHQETGEKLRKLQKQYPGYLQADTAGYTRMGLPIYAFVAGKKGKILGIVSNVHAGEGGPEIVLRALEYMLRNHREALDHFRIAGLPMLNADSRNKLSRYGHPHYIRANAAGVDLNRNFPRFWDTVTHKYGEISSLKGASTYRGPHPFSEPETKTVKRFFTEQYKPHVLFSYHHMASVASCPMNYHISITDWDRWEQRDTAYQNKCEHVAGLYGKAFFNTHEAKSWYPRPSITPGTLPAWAYEQFGIPAFDMEGGKDKITKKAARDKVSPADMKDYQKRTARAWYAIMQQYLK